MLLFLTRDLDQQGLDATHSELRETPTFRRSGEGVWKSADVPRIRKSECSNPRRRGRLMTIDMIVEKVHVFEKVCLLILLAEMAETSGLLAPPVW